MTGGSVHWVVLELRLLADESVAAAYADSRGLRLKAPTLPRHGAPSGDLRNANVADRVWPIWLPRNAARAAADLVPLLPRRVGPHVDDPARLAVYVRPPRELLALPWERAAEALLATAARVRLVR